MAEICAVCLTATDADSACMPECRHRFHVHCIINAVQYDTRCPVCRHVGEKVVNREPDFVLTAFREHADTDALQTSIAAWRRYTDRRRRVIRNCPDLSHDMQRLKEVRLEMRLVMQRLRKSYNDGCRNLWKNDPSVIQHKGQLGRMRRKELRIQKKVALALEPLIGPEPEC